MTLTRTDNGRTATMQAKLLARSCSRTLRESPCLIRRALAVFPSAGALAFLSLGAAPNAQTQETVRALTGAAHVWYVSPTGDNTDGLTPETAFTTIAAANAEALGGDLVFIMAGTYGQGIATLAWIPGVHYRGAGIGRTVITGSGTRIVKPATDSVTESMTIGSPNGASIAWGPETGQTLQRALCRGVEFLGNSDTVFLVTGVQAAESSATFENCIFRVQGDGFVLGVTRGTYVARQCSFEFAPGGRNVLVRVLNANPSLTTKLHLIGCTVSADSDADRAIAIEANGPGLEIALTDSFLFSKARHPNAQLTQLDLDVANGARVVVANTVYDSTKAITSNGGVIRSPPTPPAN